MRVGPFRVLLCLVVAASPVAARISEQVPIGPRALGMGGAYSAIADDASAVFWNPAGLVGIGHQAIEGSYADLFQSGIKDNHFAFVLPISDRHAVAADWYHSGFDDGELEFGENRFDVAYGIRLHRRLSFGASIKYLDRSINLDGTSVRRGDGIGLDLGLLAMPLAELRVGVVAQDILDTRIHYSDRDDGSSVIYPRNIRLAAAYELHRMAVLAADMDDRVHIGAEIRPLVPMALRAGYQVDRDGPRESAWSFGAGFQVGVFRADYAYVIHSSLPSTNYFGLGMTFNFNPAKVRIEKVEPREVYASLYKSYARRPIATVRLRNLDDRSIAIRLKTFAPGLMERPSEQDVILRSGVSQDLPLTAVISEGVMSQQKDLPVQIEVSATYQSQRLPRTEERTARTVAYGPGAIDWSQGVSQAAAFVTSRDSVVDTFARMALRSAVSPKEDPLANRNLRFAAALFEALGVAGVSYVPDPENPFSTVSEQAHAVDVLHYPRETIFSRAGDCDDLTILMAALLANVGVRTMLVDVPGHIFLLVDSGLHERHRLALGLHEDLSVVVDKKVWIPLETTAIDRGFAEAWRIGAAAYGNWVARGRVYLADVTTAQEEYLPSEAPSGVPNAAPPDEISLAEHVRLETNRIRAWREDFTQSRYAGFTQPKGPSIGARNELARVHFLVGDFPRALAELEQNYTEDSLSAAAVNNLGIVQFSLGQTEEAWSRFSLALRLDPLDPGIHLNLGLAWCVLGDSVGARSEFANGIRLSGGMEQALALLGISSAVFKANQAGISPSTEGIRLLLAEANQQVPRTSDEMPGVKSEARNRRRSVGSAQESSSASGSGLSQAGVAGSEMDLRRTGDAGVRALTVEQVRPLLYWKDEEGAR